MAWYQNISTGVYYEIVNTDTIARLDKDTNFQSVEDQTVTPEAADVNPPVNDNPVIDNVPTYFPRKKKEDKK